MLSHSCLVLTSDIFWYIHINDTNSLSSLLFWVLLIFLNLSFTVKHFLFLKHLHLFQTSTEMLSCWPTEVINRYTEHGKCLLTAAECGCEQAHQNREVNRFRHVEKGKGRQSYQQLSNANPHTEATSLTEGCDHSPGRRRRALNTRCCISNTSGQLNIWIGLHEISLMSTDEEALAE